MLSHDIVLMLLHKTMDEDVREELERLFTNNTTEQIAKQSAQLKEEIQQTQTQLRQLVGKRYKELLASCDMIVGMRSVCAELTSLAAASPQRKPPAAKCPGGKPSTTTESEGIMHIFRRIHSIRVLLDQEHFLEAAWGYKQAQQELAKAKENNLDEATSAFDSVSCAIEKLPSAIKQGLAESLLRHATSGDSLRSYSDAQASLEQLEGCTPSTALERLMAIHHDLFRRLGEVSGIDAVEDGIKAVVGLLTNCLAYVAQCHESGVAPTIPTSKAMSLDSLLQLDSESEDYLKIVTLQVCGMHSFDTESLSPLDGWAMSPPAAYKVKTDVSLVSQLQRVAEASVVSLLNRLVHVDHLIGVERTLTTGADAIAKECSDFSKSAWLDVIHKAVDGKLESLVQEMLALTKEATQTACQEARSSAGKAIAQQTRLFNATATQLSTPEALTELVRRRVDKRRTKQEAKTLSGQTQSLSKTVAACVRMLSSVIRRVSTVKTGGISRILDNVADSLLGMIKAVEAATSEGSSEKLSRVEREARLSKIVSTLTNMVESLETELQACELKNHDLPNLVSKLDELYLKCQDSWMEEAASTFESSLRETIQGIPVKMSSNLLRSHFADTWTSAVTEGATVHYPYTCSAGVATAVLSTHMTIASRGLTNLRSIAVSKLHSILRLRTDSILDSLNTTIQRAQDTIAEELLLQVYFDFTFLCKVLNPSGGASSASYSKFEQLVEDLVDPVSWGVAFPFIDGSIKQAVCATALTISLGTSLAVLHHPTSDHAVAIRGTKLIPEAPRLQLLPIESNIGQNTPLMTPSGKEATPFPAGSTGKPVAAAPQAQGANTLGSIGLKGLKAFGIF